MKTVIQVLDDVVLIGNAQDNSITEVRRIDCNFDPAVGDAVNVFESESKTIVTKKEIAPAVSNTNQVQDKIHINIVNDNSHKNDFIPAHAQKNVVNKVPYLLFAFFLGAFGGHKFYAGKTGLGILYLVFCWTYIPAFVALIEFILGCFKTPDAQGRIVV